MAAGARERRALALELGPENWGEKLERENWGQKTGARKLGQKTFPTLRHPLGSGLSPMS